MNILREFSKSEKLEWNATEHIASGYVNGYAFTARDTDKGYELCVYCEAPNELCELQEQISQSKAIKLEYENGRLFIIMAHTRSPEIIYFTAPVQRLCAAAHRAGLKSSACSECGGCEGLRFWKNNNETQLMCINCREKVDAERSASIVPSALPNKANIVGALIGALIGGLIYIIVYQIGNFSAILGGVIGFMAVTGYHKGNGIFTKRAAMISAQISFFVILLAQLVAVWLTFYIDFAIYGMTLWQSIPFFGKFLAYPSVLRSAMIDALVASFTMLLIHAWWYLRARKNSANTTHK